MRVHKLLCVVHGCFTAALGNAYMSLFFSGGQDAGSLQKARSSYTNAVSGVCPAAPDCPPVRTASFTAGEGRSSVLQLRSALQQSNCEWFVHVHTVRVGGVCWRCVLEVCVGSVCWRCVLEVCVGGVCWKCVLEVCVGGVLEVCVRSVCWRCVFEVFGGVLEVCVLEVCVCPSRPCPTPLCPSLSCAST